MGGQEPKPTRVGILLVHGIGEQRRFEHLDSQLRQLLRALKAANATVEVLGSNAATFQAEQESWRGGPHPAVRVVLPAGAAGQVATELFFHEVWWADINERYSFGKQLRFWWWGLSLWAQPRYRQSSLQGAKAMRLATFPGISLGRLEIVSRLRLLAVANVFLMASLSVGALVFAQQRLLNFAAPSLVRVFVNYISGVKLYVQSRRTGGGVLEGLDEPPRVAVRRRMIRALADMFSARYDRWYVLAHSLGSVVAHNGLMETEEAWPNYLDERRWRRLQRANATGMRTTPVASSMLPARPAWLASTDIVDRRAVFSRFSGFLSYGSPLDKFAALWRAEVPINDTAVFPAGTEWINVFDGTDPVAGSLDAFGPAAAIPGTLVPANVGYKASPILLLSHVRYLTRSKRLHKREGSALVDRILDWVVSGAAFSRETGVAGWYPAGGWGERRRRWSAGTQWVLTYLVLTGFAAVTAPLIWEGVVKLVSSTWSALRWSVAV